MSRDDNQSISQSKTMHDMVLLHTRDVPSSWLDMLKRVGWQLQDVDYLECHNSLYGAGRFQFVFTKLQMLNLTDYKKVVLLDTEVFFLAEQ